MQVAQLGGEVGPPLLATAAGRPQMQVAQLGGEVVPPLLATAAGRPQMQVAQLGGEVRPSLLAAAPLLSTEWAHVRPAKLALAIRRAALPSPKLGVAQSPPLP